MFRRKRKSPNAFTLLELLVVVALTALIIGMLVPSVKRSMRLARTTVCMHHMKELGHGLALYRVENKGWLPMAPPRTTRSAVVADADSDAQDVWFVKLYPVYLKDLDVLSCPDDPFRHVFQQDGSFLQNPESANFASYGINGFIMNSGGGFLANLDRHRPTRPLDTILIADIGPDDISRQSRLEPVEGPYRNASRLAWDDGYEPYSPRGTRPWLTARHGEGINVLTLDGDVRDVRTVQTIGRRNERFYRDCAAGGCTLCRELGIPHYSFAEDRLYFWTGPMPTE